MAERACYDVTFFYSEDQSEEDEDAVRSLLTPIKEHCKESGLKSYDPHRDAHLGQTIFSTRVTESLKSKSTLVFLSMTALTNNADKFLRQVLHYGNINNGQAERFAVILIGTVEPPDELSLYYNMRLQDDRSNLDEIVQKVKQFLSLVGSSEEEQEVLYRRQAQENADPKSLRGRASPVMGKGDSSLEVDSPPSRAPPAPPVSVVQPFRAEPPKPPVSVIHPFRPEPTEPPAGSVPRSDLDASDLEEEGEAPRVDDFPPRAPPDGQVSLLSRSSAAQRDDEEAEIQPQAAAPRANPEVEEGDSMWKAFLGFFTSFDG